MASTSAAFPQANRKGASQIKRFMRLSRLTAQG
jgi:hypothetical protein